jgi:salicylate hydroxylase
VAGDLLIAGGGIAGLSAAIACAGAGWLPRVFEQAAAFAEVGAGVQLGPNAVRVLRDWDLGGPLFEVSSRPTAIRSRRADDGVELACLSLRDFEGRYGAPYCTVHRADLQGLLLARARALDVPLATGTRVSQVQIASDIVRLRAGDLLCEAEALAAADGVWSMLRAHVPAAAVPTFTGDIAYRALAEQSQLPAALRSDEVVVWLGRALHVVAYPVRGGHWLNVVLVSAAAGPHAREWDQAATGVDLQGALQGACAPLRALLEAMPQWRHWPVYATPPLASPDAMAHGRIALLGDAAHPMRPYLAQGAGMAIEDAAELARMLRMAHEAKVAVPVALQRYALHRWERCARVQARARRNGTIFHATGPLRWGRDTALRALGPRLMDLPWLYRA